jgi:hypothetical protein
MYIIGGLAPGEHAIVTSATYRKPRERFRMTAAVSVRQGLSKTPTGGP